MNSYPISDLRPIGPRDSSDLLTEEQRAFAIALGRILAQQWELQQQRSATEETSPSGPLHHPEDGSGCETPSDVN